MTFLCKIIVCFLMVSCTLSQTHDDMKHLQKKLFITDEYNKNVRPETNYSQSTEVTIKFSLESINDLDEVKQAFQITGFFEISWKDDFLTWDPSNYGGLEYMYVPQDNIWKPDIALRNPNSDYKSLGSSSLNVFVSYEGQVLWTPLQLLTSSCTIQVRHFPFDTQECKLKFVAWSYLKEDIVLKIASSDVDLSPLQTNPTWTVERAKATEGCDGIITHVILSFKIRRKPHHFVFTVFLPVILLSCLSSSVFAIPCDSGERVSFSISVFLAFAVFQLIINDKLPETSDEVSLIGLYTIIEIIQSTLTVFITLIFVRKVNSDERIPNYLARLLCARTIVRVDASKEQLKSSDQTNKLYKVNVSAESHVKWKDAVKSLDLLCLIVFFAVDTILLITIVTTVTKTE